jgi:hypothetical protein
MRVAGGSLNTGPTQEQLDNAFGAVVRVMTLRPQSPDGPGLEFLEYLTPPRGRPFPAGAGANDLTHVHAVLEVDDLERLATVLEQKQTAFISSQVVSVSGMPFSRALMVKDPDGHALMLVQP